MPEEIANEVTAAGDSSPVSGASSTPTSPGSSDVSSPGPPASTPSSLRDELKKAFTSDAGSQAAPADTARPLTESERKAALAQAQGELKRKFGHLTEVDPKALQEAVRFSQAVSDPKQRVDFLASLIGEIMQNPTEATALRQRLSPHFREAPAAQPDVEPNPYVQGQDGQWYLDRDKMAEREAWRERKLRDEFQKELAPLKQTAEDLKLEKQAVAIDKEVTEWTGNIFGYISKLPDYAANWKEISAAFDEDVAPALEANPRLTASEIETIALKSYMRVTTPKAAKSAEARVQAVLKAKAEGRTASPNGNQRSSLSHKDVPEPTRLRAALKEALVDPTTGQFLK